MFDVADTAAAVARLRAEEQELPPSERLFDDPFARHFAGGAGADDALALFLRVPFFREAMRLRTRAIDDYVRAALADGIRQLVMLGAGFDCRALRLAEVAATETAVFEVDLRHQLDRKRDTLTAAGVALPAAVRLVASDFTEQDFTSRLHDDLVARGLAPGRPALVLCEGVIGYLDDPQIDRTLRWIASCAAAGSRTVLNYSVARVSPERFAARIRAAGFVAFDDRPFDELYAHYLGGPPPPGGETQRLVTAVT